MKGVLGHDRVKQVLHQSLVKNQVPHAQLFLGPEGVGKFKMALGLAQTLLCTESHVDFCGLCSSCLQVQKGQHPGLLVIDSENVQIKIEEARDLHRKLHLRNWDGARIVVINDAHKLNPQASNALLKVIEEPPEKTYFVLVTSQSGKILSTIRSRTQVVRFGPLEEQHLKTITGAEGWVLASGHGSVTRVEQLLRDESDENRKLAMRSLVDILMAQKSHLQWMEGLQAVVKDKAQLEVILETWSQMLRDLRVQGFKQACHSDLMVELQQVPVGDLTRLDQVFRIVGHMKSQLLSNVDRQLLLESGYLKMKAIMHPEQESAV